MITIMLVQKQIQRGFMLVIFCLLLLTANGQQILTLESALEIARSNSPDIQRSLLNLERSEQTLKAQNAALKSNFSLNLTPISYDKTRAFDLYNSKWNTSETTRSAGTFTISQPILPTDGTISLVNSFGWQNSFSENGFNPQPKTFSNNLYLSIAQPLFTYNRTKLTLQELQLDLENAKLSYAMQKLNNEKQVTQFFYDVYLAQMNLSISQDEFANTQKSYEITQNKVTAGIAAKEELYQAELNFATAKSTVYNAQVNLDNLKDQFKQYIGMDIMEEITVMTDVALNPVSVDVKKAIEYGLTTRMELRQREIDVETSQFTLIRTKSLNEFRGDVNLSVGIIGVNENLNNIYQNPTNNPRVSVSFNVPLYDWGEKKARIKAQEAVIQTQELNQTEQKKQITLDIRRVYRSLQNLVNQIDIASQNEKNAQLTYEINLERYANGDLTSMDMNLFQTQLSQKKMAYAQALIDYKIELLNLKIQSLYDFEKNEPIVPENIIQKKK
ncbi:MAG TPA: TolC family protein [Prolixibacteraceae bacterium]|jgi:outer membrane protein TolC|nr:TolC family protein [Prolixibacteraceae bacterium]